MLETIIIAFFMGLFFWLWMIVDCIYHEKKESDKSIWLVILCLMNVFGAFAYLALRYRANRQNVFAAETVNDAK